MIYDLVVSGFCFGIEEEFFLFDVFDLDIVCFVFVGFVVVCCDMFGEYFVEEMFECQVEVVSLVFFILVEVVCFYGQVW